MCTQAPAPGHIMCTQAPAENFKTPDWLRTGPNQSDAGAWVHIVYAGAGAWVHILASFALSVTRLGWENDEDDEDDDIVVSRDW